MMSDAVITQARKLECEIDGLYFTKYFFKERFGSKMLISEHHKTISDTLDKVVSGEITRLIINIPPGYTKTEMAVISFMARGLSLNPKSKYMHLSYSSKLALQNSTTTRDIVRSESFQSMWPIKIKADSDSKEKWWTEQGGGVYATSAGGQVTGFRAGHMDKDTFTGALIIDDPVKPDDAQYEERKKVNNRFNETIKSRLAHEGVPIIVIMQRIHKDDLSGYLLKGGSNEKWHHLNLPVKTDNSKPYPEYYTHGIPIKHRLPNGWLWPFKHSDEHASALMSHKRAYHSQYMQAPEDYNVEGALWEQEIIDRHRVTKAPELVAIVVGVDPSGDDGEEDNGADAIGIVACGVDADDHYYLIDDKTLNGSPAKWGQATVDCYNRNLASRVVGEKNYGGAMVQHTIRTVDGGKLVRYKDVTASRGKMLRAEPIAALYEQGLVHHVGNYDVLEEELTTYNGTGKSPNRLDALVWALTELSSKNNNAEISPPNVSLFN